MAAYYRVDDLQSHAGWLPVHRDLLWAQRSVTSMGCLRLLSSSYQCLYHKHPLAAVSSYHNLGFIHIYFMPLLSTPSFDQFSSLIMSSTYGSSHGKASLYFLAIASFIVTNSKVLMLSSNSEGLGQKWLSCICVSSCLVFIEVRHFCDAFTATTLHVILVAGNIFDVWSPVFLADKRCEYYIQVTEAFATTVWFVIDSFAKLLCFEEELSVLFGLFT